ncbi:MAG: hypothetical protein QM479_12430 [Pseudomonadota bacterium]
MIKLNYGQLFTQPQFLIKQFILSCTFAVIAYNCAQAANVKILAAEFHQNEIKNWVVKVTLQHDDKGWQHYANIWRIVDKNGTILGDRVLYHPHVHEQPFTRSLSNVKIPTDTRIIFIEAHDLLHGWTTKRLKIDLDKVKKNYLRIEKN